LRGEKRARGCQPRREQQGKKGPMRDLGEHDLWERRGGIGDAREKSPILARKKKTFLPKGKKKKKKRPRLKGFVNGKREGKGAVAGRTPGDHGGIFLRGEGEKNGPVSPKKGGEKEPLNCRPLS